MGKPIRESGEQKYDWVIFAQSYLLLARLGCQELLDNNKQKHSKNSTAHFPYQPADLYVSILFNIKHGIEVFTKVLGLFADGASEEGHDVKDLFSTTKERISKLKLSTGGNESIDNVTQGQMDESIEDLEKIERLVLFFFELEFIKKKLGTGFVICDSHNDVLRYPQNKAHIRIDWGTLLEQQVQLSDVEEVHKKLEELYDLFNKTGYLYAVLNRSA